MANYVININGKLYKVKGDMETLSGRKKVFDALGINVPTEAPTITDNGYTYTYGSKPKAVIGSETLKEKKINSRKGVDKFIGANRSARFDKASGLMGNTWMFHPLDYIDKNYWKSSTHKAVREGANTAAAIASAPFAAYTAALAAPFVFNGLRVAGQAMTPSTWIEGISNGFGYTIPKWISTGADLALSGYFANEAGKEIDKNGLNWKTGVNALMSLSPFTRETEAVEGVANAIRRPMLSVGSVIDDFRAARRATLNLYTTKSNMLAREFDDAVRKTQFINVPVEHVSPNGVTKGSALDVGEEGIHLSPAGSATTTNIQQTIGYPFVRTGTWTFSNNTRPVEVLDIGYFGRGFNPDFDAKVDKGVTNFKYTNRFEGNGNTSYLTIEPSFGLLLSNNVVGSLKKLGSLRVLKGSNPLILAENKGVITTKIPETIERSLLQAYTLFGSDYESLGTGGIELQKEAVDRFITPSIEELLNFYNSGFYARRLAKAGLLNNRDAILALKRQNLNNTRFGINETDNMGDAYAWTGWDDELLHPIPIMEYNVNDDGSIPLRFATLHEGSHASSLNLPSIDQHNKNLLVNIWDNVKPELRENPQVKRYIDYVTNADQPSISNPNASVTELAGQLLNAFIHMQRNNLTPELILSDYDYLRTDHELRNAIHVFKPEFLKKLLAPGGIVSSVLLFVNNKDDKNS